MRIISFSLWGTHAKYVVGAVRNAELAPSIYPGWQCLFHCGSSVPEAILSRLASHRHVHVVRRPEPGDHTSMFWRFEAAADAAADAVIFRDTDSRLNPRERAAVDTWIASGRPVHVMRDHPWHNVPILGGMWGVRGGVLPELPEAIARFPREDRYQTDQEFLAAEVAPRVRAHWLEHDEYFAGRPYPTWRRWREYVGQPFDEHDRALIAGPTSLERRLRAAVRPVRRMVRSALARRAMTQ
jgi:hypothetical protein